MDNRENTECIKQFITHNGNAEALLNAIAAKVNDHMGYSPDSLNWGHVGTMESIEERLEEIALFIGLDSERILDSAE